MSLKNDELEVKKEYFVEFNGIVFKGILSNKSINTTTGNIQILKMENCSGEQSLHQFLNEEHKLSFLVFKNKERNVIFSTQKAFIQYLGIEGARMQRNNHVSFMIIEEDDSKDNLEKIVERHRNIEFGIFTIKQCIAGTKRLREIWNKH